MKVITTAIQKGGTGKTTCVIHLAHMLAEAGHTVLVIDCDSSGNSSGAFTSVRTTDQGASRLFRKKPGNLVLKSDRSEKISIIPADSALKNVESLGAGTPAIFRANVRQLGEGFDYVVIDTSPNAGLAMTATLSAAHFSFSPLVPDKFSNNGLDLLMDTILNVQATENPELQHIGLLVNRWNSRNDYQNKTLVKLRRDWEGFIVPYEIGERAAISGTGFTGDPVWRSSGGAAGVATREIKKALGWIIQKTQE